MDSETNELWNPWGVDVGYVEIAKIGIPPDIEIPDDDDDGDGDPTDVYRGYSLSSGTTSGSSGSDESEGRGTAKRSEQQRTSGQSGQSNAYKCPDCGQNEVYATYPGVFQCDNCGAWPNKSDLMPTKGDSDDSEDSESEPTENNETEPTHECTVCGRTKYIESEPRSTDSWCRSDECGDIRRWRPI